MKISCLAVTNRPEFRAWLLWNYEKQTHADKELILIEGDRDVVHARNAALARSRGDAVAWFDDDDWSHPKRLEIAARTLGQQPGVFGSSRSAFIDLLSGRVQQLERTGGVLFNGAVVSAPYPALIAPGPAEDVRWLDACREGWTAEARAQKPMHFWLCHAKNMVNTRRRHTYPEPIGAAIDMVGADAWQDTTERLAVLRKDPAVWALS